MRQRGVVQAFIRSRKLEITFEKTQILKMGVQGKWECVLQDGNGQILGIVKETDIYRYLGMAVGRRGMIRQQIMESRAGIQSRIRRQGMQMRWQRRQICSGAIGNQAKGTIRAEVYIPYHMGKDGYAWWRRYKIYKFCTCTCAKLLILRPAAGLNLVYPFISFFGSSRWTNISYPFPVAKFSNVELVK